MYQKFRICSNFKDLIQPLVIQLQSEELHLLPDKALFWPREKVLLIADLHLGKINHFRKSGVPVPPSANHQNTAALIDVIQKTKPHRTIFLGDLFHSHYNEEWEVLRQVLVHFVGCSFELVVGNHDILSPLQYQRLGIRIHTEQLMLGPFRLTHQPTEAPSAEGYNLAGHIHPGIRLVGKAKQSLMLPCFCFGDRTGLLPAFGSFTGLYRLRLKKSDQVYVIAEDNVMKL
jgi:DNA ligase-associated metallophosphoesterase